jgi:hypothetical protein
VEALAEISGSDPANGTYNFYYNDNSRSVRRVRDSSKNSVAQYEYTPLGEEYSHSGASAARQYRNFTWDSLTNQYFDGMDYYVPSIARTGSALGGAPLLSKGRQSAGAVTPNEAPPTAPPPPPDSADPQIGLAITTLLGWEIRTPGSLQPDSTADLVRLAYTRFRPDNGCTDVSIIQIVKSWHTYRDYPSDLEWEGNPHLFSVDFNLGFRSYRDWHIDKGDPWYPLDHEGDQPDVDPNSAFMTDRPYVPGGGFQGFETCAVCQSGSSAGRIYSCLNWIAYTADDGTINYYGPQNRRDQWGNLIGYKLGKRPSALFLRLVAPYL